MEAADGTGEAIAALYRFMQEMLVWEQKYDALFEPGTTHLHAPKARRELSGIYLKHLTQRERKGGRLRSCHVGWPTEYDPDREKVECAEVLKNGRVLITTWWHHPTSPVAKRNCRYTMVCKGGVWLLDRKEQYRRMDAKWGDIVL